MHKTHILYAAVLAGSLLVAAAGQYRAQAEQDKQAGQTTTRPARAEIGAPAPDFALVSTGGEKHRLSDHRDKIVVLEWVNKDCPFSNFSKGAGPRMKALYDEYRAKGVVWFGIDSTHSHQAADIAAYTREHKIPYPILMDTDGAVGRRYEAKTTPHIFIVNKGKLAYMGAHDDRGKRNYIAEALDALLAGHEVPSPVTNPYGCSVKYKR
ncbi:MAG: redoxin domain-containing protein [Planctomycetes bacterium]|nr:redoxin domain-containing protein [Planctomycetota bacterium]